MRMRVLTFAVLSAVLAAPNACFAVRITSFPGLDALIERADVIAVVVIRGPAEPGSSPNLYETRDCYVSTVLKGDVPLPRDRTVSMRLCDTGRARLSPFGPSSFAPESGHLVFLHKESRGDGTVDYRSIQCDGAHFPVSLGGTEGLPEDAPIAEKVRFLARRHVEAEKRARAREDALIREDPRPLNRPPSMIPGGDGPAVTSKG